MTEVLFAVEGTTDVPVAEKIIRVVGRTPRLVLASGGSAAIDARLERWARQSNRTPMLILRDWDLADAAACAPELRARIAGPLCPENVAVRIVARSIESWLMADRDAAEDFFRTRQLPDAPEQLDRPKLALVNACRASSLRRVRQGMCPGPGSRSAVGLDYARLITDFGANHWDPSRARLRAASLDRTLARLEQLVDDGHW